MTGQNDIALREKVQKTLKAKRKTARKAEVNPQWNYEPWESRFGLSVSDLLLEGKTVEIEMTDMFAALTRDFKNQRKATR